MAAERRTSHLPTCAQHLEVPETGLCGSQETGCYVQSQETGFYVQSQETGFYIQSQETGFYVQSQETGCYVQSQETGFYVQSQETGFYVQSQETGCYVQSQETGFYVPSNLMMTSGWGVQWPSATQTLVISKVNMNALIDSAIRGFCQLQVVYEKCRKSQVKIRAEDEYIKQLSTSTPICTRQLIPYAYESNDDAM